MTEEKKLNRRTFLRVSAFTLIAAALQACAPSTATPKPVVQPTKPPAPTATPTKPPAPTATPTKAGPVKGGTFTDVSFADAQTMQPLLASDTASFAYIDLVYGYLLRRDPKTLALVGDMAESYIFSEDGMTLTVKLRKNLKWSDGKPITAADFQFTWDKMMDEKVNYVYRAPRKENYESMTAIDDYTLVFKLKRIFCPAIDYANIQPIPKHVFENLDINQNDFNTKPTVFSGPFRLQEWVKDSHAIFVASDSFHRGRPNLDKYIYKIVKDNTVATAMFKTQEVDICTPDPVDWAEIKALPHAQGFEYYVIGAGWVYIGFKLDHPFFSDVRVRQALSHALDKQKLIEKIRLGFARPQYSFIHGANWAYTDDLPKYEFNPEKAKSLLKEAGWTPGADGILTKDGKPFKVRIFYNAGNKQREQIATIAQQYFKDVGVSIEIQSEEWNAYLDRIRKTRDFEMFILGWAGGADPHGQANIWSTGKAQNYIAYSNPTVDKLFEEAAAVKGCQQEDRKKIYVELQRIIAQDAGYIFLFTNQNLVAVHNRMVVNPVTPLGIGYDLQDWYSKTGK